MMIILYIILLLLLRQDTYTLNSFTNSSMVVWSPSPVKIKAHPFFARLRAMPSPIPLVEPVTKATLPLKSITKTLQLFWLSFNVCSMIYKYIFTTFEDNLLSMYLWSLLLVWKLLLENCTLTGSFSHNIIYKGRIKAGLHCYFGDSWKKEYILLY